MKRAIVILVLAGCAAEPVNEERAGERKVVERAPNGLPIVQTEVLPFPEHEVRSAPPGKASIEPFVCTDENGGNCRRPRSSWTTTDIRPSQKHTIWGIGDNNGYAYARYRVRNQRSQTYWFESHPSTGSFGWWFEYPPGSACNDGTYNPQNCKWDICLLEAGFCITTHVLRGSTFAFHSQSWSPYETMTFEVFHTAYGGPIPMTATFEQILLLHNDITQ